MTDYQRGSEWRRWDLHIHTPETNKNDKFEGENPNEKWEKYYKDISDYIGDGSDVNKSIAAIGITDYLSIENYNKVISDNKLPSSIKLILPNVEMRMIPVASQSPINIHCIFSPDIAKDLNTLFFNNLKFNYKDRDYSANKDDLVRLGRDYESDQSIDENKAYKIGINQFIVDKNTLQKLFKSDPKLRDNTVIIVSNKSTDGVSGTNAHKDYFEGDVSALDATRREIYRMSDFIFSSNEKDIKYFLGDCTGILNL